MDTKQAILGLTALAQTHRLEIFRLLVRQGSSGLSAGAIAKEIGIGATSASFHLKELDRAGLIQSKRNGRFIEYAVYIEGIRSLLMFLTEDCCQGREEICGKILTHSVEFCN
ncbi:MAG: helix-turn-helix domain-containing protein [Pseudomonadota bacterium]